MSIQEAQKQLDTAKKHLERVRIASFESTEEDREEGVTWAFYAYENCVVAIAEALDRSWKKITNRKPNLLRNCMKRASCLGTSKALLRN